MKRETRNWKPGRRETPGIPRVLCGVLGLVVAGWCAAEEATVPATHAPAASLKEPFREEFKGYRPDFIERIARNSGWNGALKVCVAPNKEEMDLSAEKEFYTVSRVQQSDRADALVKAGIEKEREGRYREALEVYQKVIDEYPNMLFRVSGYGVFVPIGQYCQLRILGFPREHLDFYRVKYDSRAKDAFDIARSKNSLEGLAEIRDKMLGTSYGSQALLTLGMAAMDRGHYLEALEYFEQVWEYFPDPAVRAPELTLSMALCRKKLGMEAKVGERYGLVGHWKLDEGKGNRAMDSSGFGSHGTLDGLGPVPTWTEGKIGGAHRFTVNTNGYGNAVIVQPSAFTDLAVGGMGFSVAFWIQYESGDDLFSKKIPTDVNQTFLLGASGGRLTYTLATQNPTLEKGASKRALTRGGWTHVAFVNAGRDVKIFLDGRLDTHHTLNGAPLRNAGILVFGGGMNAYGGTLTGCLDDVRLYNRPLLDREVAEFAGTLGTASLTANPATGQAPLAVELAAAGPGADQTARCFWEFGDGETGTGPRVRHTYAIGGRFAVTLTVTQTNGAVSAARSTISVTWPPKVAGLAQTLTGLLEAARDERPARGEQRASAPHVAADDYLLFPPTRDPLGIQAPVWEEALAGGRTEVYAHSQPVLTEHSVLLRHKNIVYCHSILNGALRWKNDLGGRVTWQNGNERQDPQEDLLIQDGLVFTPMYKVGPTLVALDEITGQMKWAYGPMVASTEDESKIRFEAAPAGGPLTVYAGYVLDNIEGDTHVDTEYGVMAFESATGRVKWRTPLCRLQPGKFSAGFAQRRRHKIRSFTSPPLYHEGTVYYGSNAGAIAALDALSGRIKWLMRYPYYAFPDSIHDATKPVSTPPLWYNQRPLLIGDNLLVLPVDSPLMFSLERKTGKVAWSKIRENAGPGYFLGQTASGELAFAYSLVRYGDHRGFGGGVHLADPHTGNTIWQSGDLVAKRTQPLLKYNWSDLNNGFWAFGANGWSYMTTARPFLTSDNRVIVTSYFYYAWPYWSWASNLAVVDLAQRKILDRRNYLDGVFLVESARSIKDVGGKIKQLEDIPHKDDAVKRMIQELKEIQGDTVPVNPHGPFLPFSRITRELYGTSFELRTTARSVAMVYDREAVKKALATREDPPGLLARAELAVADGRLEETAELLKLCLARLPSEDWDSRALVNQQLYQVYRRLAQGGVRGGRKDVETANVVGMSQTVNNREQEMETLLALSEAHERRGDLLTAARMAQKLVHTYGQDEYPIPSVFATADSVRTAAETTLSRAEAFVARHPYRDEIGGAAGLMKKGLGLYFGALTPLKKDLRLRAGELGARRLLALRKADAGVAGDLEKEAASVLGAGAPEDALRRLWEFPGTAAGQNLVNRLLESLETVLGKPDATLEQAAAARKSQWAIADAARICGLNLPDKTKGRLLAPGAESASAPVAGPMQDRAANLEEGRGPAWLVLERRGQAETEPDRLFLGGRVKKKLDNKFLLYCLDLKTGETVWKAEEKRGDQWFDEIRLQGQGDEPGFFEAFVFRDLVIVHGRYDVLAFGLKDGKLRWRYLVPFAFEIRYAEMSGDVLALAGEAATVALHLGTQDPRGETIWEEKEEGDLYLPPYFVGDRLISVRKMPFNVTVRYRGTGKLMGRLALPDLSLHEEHPLIEKGPRALPAARDGNRLAVTDGWYYLLLDTEQMRIVWKRAVDANDPTRFPPMRLELDGDYLAVVKQDYDAKTIYMLSSRTGEVLWKTDPKDPNSPQPIDGMLIRDGKLYGIKPHAGQGFYFAALDCKTGKPLFRFNEQTGYGGKPEVRLRHALYGGAVVAEIRDRQDYELKAFDVASGQLLHALKVKGAGELGVHGCASAVVQNGALALLGKNELKMAAKK